MPDTSTDVQVIESVALHERPGDITALVTCDARVDTSVPTSASDLITANRWSAAFGVPVGNWDPKPTVRSRRLAFA